jgi:hypothetical protein
MGIIPTYFSIVGMGCVIVDDRQAAFLGDGNIIVAGSTVGGVVGHDIATYNYSRILKVSTRRSKAMSVSRFPIGNNTSMSTM